MYVLKYCFLLVFLIAHNKQILAQEGASISLGYGLPELMNIGFQYQKSDVQIGFSVGTNPFEHNKFALSSALFFYFGKHSDLSERRLWHFRIGIDYLRDERKTVTHKYLLLDSRIGRDIYISRQVGIRVSLGLSYILEHEKIYKQPPSVYSGWFDFDLPIYGGSGISVFCRI